jgi:hypothetical protein
MDGMYQSNEQRNYYEQITRNDEDERRIVANFRDNPLSWEK